MQTVKMEVSYGEKNNGDSRYPFKAEVGKMQLAVPSELK